MLENHASGISVFVYCLPCERFYAGAINETGRGFRAQRTLLQDGERRTLLLMASPQNAAQDLLGAPRSVRLPLQTLRINTR